MHNLKRCLNKLAIWTLSYNTIHFILISYKTHKTNEIACYVISNFDIMTVLYIYIICVQTVYTQNIIILSILIVNYKVFVFFLILIGSSHKTFILLDKLENTVFFLLYNYNITI